MMKKLFLSLFFLVLLSSFVFGRPINNPNFVNRVSFVDFTDSVRFTNRVGSLLSQPPEVMVAGTEYQSGDYGKAFLQLSDNGVPVDNASCTMNIYYPNGTLWVEDTALIQHVNGLQYYPFVAPSVEGVYMISANCQYYIINQWFYDLVGDNESSVKTVLQGNNPVGSTYVLNDFNGLYESIESDKIDGDHLTEVVYNFSNDWSNISSPTLFWAGASDGDPLLTFSYLNYSNSQYVNLSNQIQLISIDLEDGNTPSINQFVTNILPLEAFNSGEVMIKIYTSDTSKYVLYNNWLNIRSSLITNQSVSQLRGGGEIVIDNTEQEILDNIALHNDSMFNEFFVHNITWHGWYLSLYGLLEDFNISEEYHFSVLSDQLYNLSVQLDDNTSVVLNRLDAVNFSINSYLDSLDGLVLDSYLNLSSELDNLSIEVISNVSVNIWSSDNRTLTANPQSFIGGTEYSTKELVGKVVVRIIDGSGVPVSNADCRLSVYNPNNSIYLNDLNMIEASVVNGIYYADFNLSGNVGVHPYGVDCNKSGNNYFLLSTYHVFDNNFDFLNESFLNLSSQISFLPDYNSNFSDVLSAISNVNTSNQDVLDVLQSLNSSIVDVNISVFINDSRLNDLESLLLSSYSNLTLEHDYTQSLVLSAYNNLSLDIDSIPFINYSSNFSSLSSQVSGVSSQVSTLSSDVANLDSDIASLTSNLSSHDSFVNSRLDDLEVKIDLILDKLNIHLDAINLEATTIDCLEGSSWSIEVTAFDSFENYLNDGDLECNVTTSLWGTQPLIWSGDSFDYSHVCGYGNDTITWVVNCEEI